MPEKKPKADESSLNNPEETEVLDLEPENDDSEATLVEYDIASYPSDYTLRGLVTMWGEKGITIPDFQRSYVWSIKQASSLIESFLIGLPVPPLFFYIDPHNKNLVVDGQQRLMSVVFYMSGFFGQENEKGTRQVFKLTGLNPKSPYHEKRFSDLESDQKRKLEQSVLRAINIRQLSPKEENTSIYHIFERLNTGGTPLTPQEIRNVVFRGEFFKELKILNKDKNWREILGKKIPDKHLKDIELLIRVFGLSNYLKSYEKPMSEFLNKVSSKNKEGDTKIFTSFKNDFSTVTKVIIDELGKKPFNIRGPFNMSAFDSIFCNILNHLRKLPKNLNERYIKLKNDQNFVDLTTLATTDKKVLEERFKYVENKLIK